MNGDLLLREFAKTLIGLDKEDKEIAEGMAFYAGYSAYEFGQAWALRGVV